MAQSVEHIVHIDGVVGSSPTVTTTQRSLRNQASLSFCLRPGGTHLPYTKFGVGKVTVHLISQTFDVNEIAGRCKQGAGNKRSAPGQAPSDDITGHAKKQKSGAARSASRLTAQAVCQMNCSQPAPFTSRYPQMLPS